MLAVNPIFTYFSCTFQTRTKLVIHSGLAHCWLLSAFSSFSPLSLSLSPSVRCPSINAATRSHDCGTVTFELCIRPDAATSEYYRVIRTDANPGGSPQIKLIQSVSVEPLLHFGRGDARTLDERTRAVTLIPSRVSIINVFSIIYCIYLWRIRYYRTIRLNYVVEREKNRLFCRMKICQFF